uniref:Uncharacterized protein n=1 Tax=Glossina pallidipes TaxID=7398 RepID=A0A1B0ACJ1_GLOPL
MHCCSKSWCRGWLSRFKSSLENKAERGQPSDCDDQALLAAVKEDRSLATRMLADNFNVDHSTMVSRLKKLKRKHFKTNGNNIAVVGEFSVLVKFCDQSKNLLFLIANTGSPSRLRRDFMILFGSVSLNINPANQIAQIFKATSGKQQAEGQTMMSDSKYSNHQSFNMKSSKYKENFDERQQTSGNNREQKATRTMKLLC